MDEPSETEAQLPPESKKSSTYLIAAIVFIVLVIVAMFLWIRLGTPKQLTLDQVLDETLKGKSSPDNFMYNNYAFVKAQDMWYFRWQKGTNLYTIPLRYNPLQVQNVTIEGNLDKSFDPANLYITFDPRSESFKYITLAAGELSLNLAKALDTLPKAACLVNDTDVCNGIPVVSCQDSDKAVIFLREANVTAVLLNGNCMTIQGNQLQLVRAVDRVLYIWYGVMPRTLNSSSVQ